MRTILCNNCYKKLTKKELEVYSIQWQYSGDMYCMSCRDCPDDCRYTSCSLNKNPKQEIGTMDEKINKLLEVLQPCLKKEKHNGYLQYPTAWGYKTAQGLNATIKAVMEEK